MTMVFTRAIELENRVGFAEIDGEVGGLIGLDDLDYVAGRPSSLRQPSA
jgi:hypothetical protein